MLSFLLFSFKLVFLISCCCCLEAGRGSCVCVCVSSVLWAGWHHLTFFIWRRVERKGNEREVEVLFLTVFIKVEDIRTDGEAL